MRGVNGFAKTVKVSGASRLARKRIRACLRAGDAGNTIVEMALMLPILMMTMMGIFVLGTIMMNYSALTQATGSTSDYLQSLSSEPVGTDVCNLAWTFFIGRAPTLNNSNLTVTVTLDGSSVSGTTASPPSCLKTSTNMASGVTVAVGAKYQCSFAIYGHDYSGGNCLLTAPTNSQLIH